MSVINDTIANTSNTINTDQFLELCNKFRAYHNTKINVDLHLITTPLAVWASISAITKLLKGNYSYSIGAMVSYLILLSIEISVGIFIPTAICVTVITILSIVFGHKLSWKTLIIAFCLGYFGQDLAHMYSGEETFQSSYQQDNDFWIQLLEHTYYLLPLVFDARLPIHDTKRIQKPIIVIDNINANEHHFTYISISIGILVIIVWNKILYSTKPISSTEQLLSTKKDN